MYDKPRIKAIIMATNAKKARQQHTKMHTRLMRDNKPSKQSPEILGLRNDKT